MKIVEKQFLWFNSEMQATPKEIDYCEKLKISVRATYNAIGSIYCPVLGDQVQFNSMGFHHFSYKPDGTARDTRAVIYKLTRFPLAIPVIKNAIGIAETRDVIVRVGRGRKTKTKQAKSYALVAEVGKKNPTQIRVIVLKIDNGKNYIYYSIMDD